MKHFINKQAEILNKVLKKTFTYRALVMLTLLIEYPQILLKGNSSAQTRINLRYRRETQNFYRHAEAELLPSAVQEYHDSIKNGFPFRPYDAVMKYTVTMNEQCTLSTYSDAYEFTGGAHGNTRRTSDSWELQSGRRLRMAGFFSSGTDYKAQVLWQIEKLAEQKIKEDPNLFFDNYKELIKQYFNPESFYLTPEALVVYYQQYEIGPYVSGIVNFEIPYASLKIPPPNCASAS